MRNACKKQVATALVSDVILGSLISSTGGRKTIKKNSIQSNYSFI